MNGDAIQKTKITRPANATKIWKKTPIIIRTILIETPKILETKFEIKALKNSTISKPFGYLQLYLRHGAKNVLSKSPIEKKFAA